MYMILIINILHDNFIFSFFFIIFLLYLLFKSNNKNRFQIPFISYFFIVKKHFFNQKKKYFDVILHNETEFMIKHVIIFCASD